MKRELGWDRLRSLFVAREGKGEDRDRPDPETLWRAVVGELPVVELEKLTDRLADDPQLASEWRIALELYRAQEATSLGAVIELPKREEPGESGAVPGSTQPRPLRRLYLAAAAAVIASVTGALFFFSSQPPETVYRGQEEPAIRALVEPSRALPRDGFVLRWTPLPKGTLYELVVSDSELEVLVVLNKLYEPQAQVPSAALESLASGETVRWQVIATDREGRRHRSPTFEARVR